MEDRLQEKGLTNIAQAHKEHYDDKDEHSPTSPHQVISYNCSLQMMRRLRIRLGGFGLIDLYWCVRRLIVLLIEAHRWAQHWRIDAATHARHSNWRRLFRRSHLKRERIELSSRSSTIDIQLLTSKPMLPFNENLMGFEWLLACINVVKWLMPISSSDDLRRPVLLPRLGNPCRSELERLRRMSLSIWKAQHKDDDDDDADGTKS